MNGTNYEAYITAKSSNRPKRETSLKIDDLSGSVFMIEICPIFK